jgi:hypothetical protein
VQVRIFSLIAALVAAVVVVGGSGAGTTKVRKATQIDVSTRSAVIHYLRSIHVNPRGVVIQRGVRNYAGPKCPGKGWTCAGTARTVVQVASRGGKNTFACATASCAIVQVAAAPTATNTAKCIKTTGLSGSCSINQTSSSANNVAIVVQGQVAGAKMSGLSQTASYTAQITQRTTADSAFNRACVLQQVNIDGSTNLSGKKGVGVSVNLAAHQSVTVKQDSLSGANTVKRATASGTCDADGTALTQDQTLTSTATGTAGITQNQNSVDTGPNVSLDIAQNKSGGFEGATGPNTAKFNQTNTLNAIANTPAGPVSQTQSSANGGILATVNQNSQVGSTAIATQTETQCEDAHTAFTTTCHTATPDPPGYTLTQTQHGPVRKGVGDSVQTGGGSANVFTITQTSKQDNDTGSGQTNVVQGDCHTEGNCTVEQTTTVQGDTTTNTQSGQDIDTTTTCTGAECTPTCTGESCVTPEITFDGSPGTGAPPATLGPYNMTAFGADPQPLNNGPVVTSVNDPAGTIGFTPALNHSRVGNGWATWSHGYTGDVYWTNTGSTITITLPSGTTAFYLYAEPNSLSPFTVTATAQDGTTSGPTTVDGNGGARYFGFYGTGGATLAFITVTTNDTAGLGVGEFGISPSAAPPIT